ncbi:MAG: response regulator [Oscillochloridaceae bacterium umkhey_bin13]
MITILIADDHTIVRDGLRALLETQSDLQVLATAGDGREAVQLTQQLQPQVVLMDIAMPLLNGIEALHQIQTSCPHTRVVILSIHATSEHIYRALQAGAMGYLLKESAGSEVITAVRAVAVGQRYLSRRINETILHEYGGQGPSRSPLASLSERERQVLQLTVEGQTAAQIAEQLTLSPKTVETYRSRVMQKLGLADLPALVKFAIQHGITPLE